VKGDIKLIGVNNHKWKGDDVGYFGLHSWLSRKYGKPVECEKCGSIKKIGWASKNYKYTRNREDWIHLCSNCNFEYDRKNGWGIASKIYPEIRSSYAVS